MEEANGNIFVGDWRKRKDERDEGCHYFTLCTGPQMLETYDQPIFGKDEDGDDPDALFTKLEEYCCPRTNKV